MDFQSRAESRQEAAMASIQQLRSRLLDLTARNPLVSFPHSRATGTRAHVRAVNGHVDTLFAHLGEGKPLAIRPLPAPEDEPADEKEPRFRTALEAARLTDERYGDEAAELSADESSSSKAAAVERRLRDQVRESLVLPARKVGPPTSLAEHAAKFGIDSSFDLRPTETTPGRTGARPAVEFQALVLPDALERQLARIRDTARTVAEETGVSTLHLAFGFLQWFESDASDRAVTSPLLLLRVDIDRHIARSRYQYVLTTAGDDAEVNLTLSERLDRDFRIKLPALAEDETPEAYLARVEEEVCRDRPRWAVHRFVTLAHFPFARLAMFQDLDEHRWDGGLASHPVLAALLGGKDPGPSMFAAEHDVDAPAVAAKAPVLVLDADASQHSAVYDVMCGQDLVIEGPPGTGKSQTIANIVAAALSNGKRVLFVADKQAALQVVKDRLDKVGLGDFCLELHSGKARKTDFLASLGQRLARRPAAKRTDRLDDTLRSLAATRAALTHYADLLNAPFGALRTTVHDVLWADRRRRNGEGAEAGRLDAIRLESAETLLASDIDARRAALDRFERAAAPLLAGLGELAAHPWWGVTRSDLPSVDMDGAVRDTADTASAMAAVADEAERLHPFGLCSDVALDQLGPMVRALAAVEVADAALEWFAAFAAPGLRAAAGAWRQACQRYRDALEAQAKLIALPPGVACGTACDRLASAWPAVARTVPAEAAVGGLAALATSLRKEASVLADVETTATETLAVLAIPDAESLHDVAMAAQAASLAAELPQEVADGVTPELMHPASAGIVRSHSAAIRALQARQAELDLQYCLPPSARPAALRQHAAALATAGLFGFMRPAVKAAKLAFTGLLRTPRKDGTGAMAAALLRVAEHLEAVAALGSDEARHAFGAAYRGIATDVDAALAAVGWAARVRSAFPRTTGAGAAASASLLAARPDRLRALRALASRPEHGVLQAWLARFPPATRSFAELANRLAAEAGAVEALASLCRELGVPDGARTSALPGVAAALRTTAEAETAARLPPALAFPDVACPSPLDVDGPFDAALRLAASVAGLTLPEPVRAALWQASPDTLRTAVVPAARAATDALADALGRWATLQALLGLDEEKLYGRRLGDATARTVQIRLAAAAAQPGALGGWILYLREREAAEAFGLGGLLRLWDEHALPGPLPAAFDRVFHRALARAAFGQHPELERFTGLGQAETRARFAALDAEATALRRQHLAENLARRPVPGGIGMGKPSELTEQALILREIGKQKRHLPIRQLLDRAGAAVQVLKPCFMMSPISVAQYLKPGGLGFDLLVIDEASQMRPEDALGAVARCSQIVVVGDPKQLPPTAFFARGDDADDDDAEEEVEAESILDLAQAVFRPMRRLRWHYRSRHGSLVAFSNREFYDDDLIVFPSPAEADGSQGVATVKVDGIYKARSNVAEVAAVCAAAAGHMRTCPDRSLGIATMNQVQQELIALEMDRLTAGDPELEAYRERWNGTLERFFVKNLENVQGDERDVIFVSTVFGPATPGGKVLQRFGPINGASGHRRLNVLFTRAKHQLRLFTSMTSDDVLAGPGSPRGAQVLKAYLAYAQTGRLEAGAETGREADSDFEVFVRDRLRAAGYDAAPQVGVAGFFIDLAVRDPRSPGNFLLGIECDGASYHSSRSARDRDVLRQQVLEGLGWTIYRIWSTDWFRDPAGQTAKLLSFIEETARGDAR